MANVLGKDKQIAIIGALAEGSSIRSIERMTGTHRDTIMRLGVKVGKVARLSLTTKCASCLARISRLTSWGIHRQERAPCTAHR